MLPSTGYFKAINCPFYENGYCERPYCHFRHTRPSRDAVGTSTTTAAQVSQEVQKPQNTNSTSVTATTPTAIEHLVSEAVKKVLAEQTLKDTEKIVNKVVEGLKPKLVPAVITGAPPVSKPSILINDPIVAQHGNLPVASTTKPSKCTYNPTPISELQRRHIPVPSYQPSKESRAVKRKSPDMELPWMDVIRNVSKKESKVGYTPTSITYAPSVQTYEERRAEKRRRRKEKDSYRPKQKKRREEYVPRRPKVPLKDKQPLDDDIDVFNDIFGDTNPNSSITIDDDSQDLMEIEPKFSDDESVENATKDDKAKDTFQNTVSDDRGVSKSNEDYEIDDNEDDRSSNHSDREPQFDNLDEELHSDHDDRGKSEKHKDFSRCSKDISKSKPPEKTSSREDSKRNKHKDKEKDGSRDVKGKDDSKGNRSKENDWRNVKIKEEGSKHSKSRDEDFKHKDSKSKDKDRESDKKDKDKEKIKERDKHKLISKSSDKERSSSSKDSRGKDRDKDKDREREKDRDKEKEKEREKDRDKEREKDRDRDKSKDSKKSKESTHNIKKEIKLEKERSSSKDSKDRNKYKTDDKYKIKSSLSDSKNKSSTKHSHKSIDEPGSNSSHKSSKSNRASSADSEQHSSDEQIKSEEPYDYEKKLDSPEYEEFSPIYDEQLLETDSDYDVEEECRKIFQEYEEDDVPKDTTSKAPPKPEFEEFEEVSKKRVAHSSAVASLIKQVGPNQPVKRAINPQQRMYERWRLMKEIAAQKTMEKAEKATGVKAAESSFVKKIAQSSSTDHQVNGNGRIRIAQVPYAMSLTLEKKKVMEQAAKIEMKTVAQTKKGARIAHVPQVIPQLIRPEPLNISGTQKFPLNVRQFYVNAMQDICIQIYDSHEDAAQRALQEELACYERCKAVNVYKNSCMLTVHRLRKEVDQKTVDPTTSYSGLISHEAVLAGKVKGSWSVVKQKKASSVEVKGTALYCMLRKWILSEQELKDNGYPRPHPDGPKGRAKLYVVNNRGQSTLSKVPNERFCCRCHKPYYVDKYGFPLRKENCIYHYARKFTFRGETKYMCCKQDGSSDGCCDATTHVWDFVDVENLRGYVETFDKDNISVDEHGVYALDCEMCYTTQGLELTRVTVIDENLQVNYESLVKPSHPIIDYNTRFSGISEKDMENVTTTLLDVQATFLSMFSSKTILIGHSLESDFKALKLLHNTVVDTSVMFPHKNGPPFKRALKNLVSEHLRRIIQNDLGGHDSKEDALACMELVFWKIKEELKLQ